MSKCRMTFVLFFAGLLTTVATVSAEPTGGAKGRHCVTQLAPAGLDPALLKAFETFDCFPTFRDAIFFATKGRILLPKRSFDEQLNILDREIKARRGDLTKAGSFVVAIDYEHINYGGSTLTWTAPGPCAPEGGWVASNMGSSFWNDRVSSTRGFSNCDKNVLWEHQNFAGSKLTCRPNCSSMGSFNDKASSREWHHLCEGVAGQWSGCRGTGCSVCSELVANYPCYFQNHPNCASNSACGGLYFTCSDACPAPSQADTCVCSATAFCDEGGSVSCTGTCGTTFAVPGCYVECDGEQTACDNPPHICPL